MKKETKLKLVLLVIFIVLIYLGILLTCVIPFSNPCKSSKAIQLEKDMNRLKLEIKRIEPVLNNRALSLQKEYTYILGIKDINEYNILLERYNASFDEWKKDKIIFDAFVKEYWTKNNEWWILVSGKPYNGIEKKHSDEIINK
jgi:hypothetical protein